MVLLDVEPAAAFVRMESGETALVRATAASRGIAASVGAHLDLWETGVDVEVGPDGVRTAVDLLELGDEDAASPSDGLEGVDLRSPGRGSTSRTA